MRLRCENRGWKMGRWEDNAREYSLNIHDEYFFFQCLFSVFSVNKHWKWSIHWIYTELTRNIHRIFIHCEYFVEICWIYIENVENLVYIHWKREYTLKKQGEYFFFTEYSTPKQHCFWSFYNVNSVKRTRKIQMNIFFN